MHYYYYCYYLRRYHLLVELVSVVYLIWQHVPTSEGHFQSSSIKYIKGILHNLFYAFYTTGLKVQIKDISLVITMYTGRVALNDTLLIPGVVF
jgi:hypothetical protein